MFSGRSDRAATKAASPGHAGGRKGRAAGLMVGSALIALSAALSTPAGAQSARAERVSARTDYAIAPQPLSRALVAFSRASGLQLFFDANLVRDKNSPGTSGKQTHAQALGQLLGGTGLAYRIDGNTVTISTGTGREYGYPVAADGESTLLERLVVDVGAGADSTVGTNTVVIGREDLERKQASDIQEIFAGEPAIAVGGAISSTQKIYVNGIDETNLAVTVDGSRQNNKVFHHNGTYLLDPALLKAVTVQPTVAPADAGPAALAGSMGFETVDVADLLDPDRDFGGFVSGTWDSNSGTYIAGASAYGKVGGFEYLGYVNYSRGGNFTAGNGQEMAGTGTNLLSGLGKIAYEAEEHRFEVSHERVRDDALRPYRANFYFHRGMEPEVRRYELNRQNTVFTYNTVTPNGWWDPKVVLAYSQTTVETPYYHPGTGAATDGGGTTASFNGKVENRFNLETGSVTAGVDFYKDKASLRYDYTPPEEADERATNIGAYAQARLEPTDRIRLAFGGRLDNQWFTGTDGSDFRHAGLSGNVSGEYDIVPDHLTLKAGAARVWGGIPLAENFIQNAAWVYGDGPDPVTAANLTAGVEARYEGLTLEGTVFMTDIRNARFPDWGGQPNRSYDLDSWGWEVGARYDWDSGFVGAKYTNVVAKIDGAYADTDLGRYITTPIGEIIMVSAGYTFQDWGLTIGGDAEFALENRRTAEEHPVNAGYPKLPLPAYQVFNAFVEYTPPSHDNLTLRIEARNIFDTAYTSRASYGQDFDGTMPHLEPGRTFRFNARLKF